MSITALTLAIGKFQVSKYAAPGGSAAAAGGVGTGLDFGLGTVGGNQFGGGGVGQLIPSNVFPNLIGPGGEVMPGGGGTPLPGGVGLENPAYADHPGPFWDPTSNGGIYGTDVFRGDRPAKTFGSRILNVNLPKMISAGQPFAIIVTYVHQGDAFTTYKVKCNIPILQIMETSQEKRVANGGQDNVVINLTAPAPLPNGVITGTVELVQTEGNEVTVDSEIITIPSEVVPNPPMPVPPPGPGTPPYPVPVPEPSPPPTAPPPPPVPIPPVLQLIAVTVTRGEEGGLPTIVIEASNLEASEPCTLFVYLSHRPGGHRGWGRGGRDDRGRDSDHNDWDRGDRGDHDWNRETWISKQTPAGSIAASNIAYAYPTTVSVNGITAAGNGLNMTRMPTVSSIQNQVRSQINQTQSRTQSLTSLQSTIRARVSSALAARGISTAIANIAANAAANTAVASNGNATASANAAGQAAVAAAIAGGGSSSSSASAIGNVAAATAGQAVAVAVASIAVGEPHPGGSGPIIDPRQLPRPIFKRQKVSLTATEAGTIRHVIRVQSAPVTAKLNGYVIVYGHRSKRHSGRKPFSL